MDKDSSKEINQYSLDTGNGANILQPHYFTMNRDHLDGKLTPMLIGNQVSAIKTETLIINPKLTKSTSGATEDL